MIIAERKNRLSTAAAVLYTSMYIYGDRFKQ
jgi:hypothetical protein